MLEGLMKEKILHDMKTIARTILKIQAEKDINKIKSELKDLVVELDDLYQDVETEYKEE
jgi:hypothetical protein